MHNVLALLALVAFSTEESFYHRMKRKNTLPNVPTEEGEGRQLTDIFDILRLLELLLIALILSTPAGNPANTHGQIAMILAGLQLARLFGRRILAAWSVLGVLQLIEAALLVLFLLTPLSRGNLQRFPLTFQAVLAMAGGVLYAVIIMVCAAFSISYWMKYFAREHTPTYKTFLPLADSESWAVRISRKAIIPGLAGLAGIVLISGLSSMSVFLGVSILLQVSGLLVVKRLASLEHHPLAHVLWTASFLLITGMIVFGATNFAPL